MTRPLVRQQPGLEGVVTTVVRDERCGAIMRRQDAKAMQPVELALEAALLVTKNGGSTVAADRTFGDILTGCKQERICRGSDHPAPQTGRNLPKLKFLLAHGGYPAVIEALALVTKHRNFYISPDVYCFFPAGKLYINSITKLQDQFVFA
jgi:hypothetical protein